MIHVVNQDDRLLNFRGEKITVRLHVQRRQREMLVLNKQVKQIGDIIFNAGTTIKNIHPSSKKKLRRKLSKLRKFLKLLGFAV